MNPFVKYVYEFIGTFFLVLTVGMCVLNPGSIGNFAPLAIGLVLAAMVFAGGYISGAHYNPAVSLAVAIRGKLGMKDLFAYWIAQLLAGAIAAFIVLYLKKAALAPVANFDTARALIAEFLFTFALCFVVLNVATAKETTGNSFYGLAIGITVLAGAYAVGSISGAAFNPAVALGITIMNLSVWANLWVFVVSNFLGAIAAALVFKATNPQE